MTLVSVYVLQIPELSKNFDQRDWEQWELFLLETSKEYRLISGRVSSSTDIFTFHDVRLYRGHLNEIRVDLKKREITFSNGTMSDREFKRYLKTVLHNLVLRTDQHRMVFLTSRKNIRQKL